MKTKKLYKSFTGETIEVDSDVVDYIAELVEENKTQRERITELNLEVFGLLNKYRNVKVLE